VGYVAPLKGTMSEAELHWLRSRLLGGKLEKAQSGQLRFRPPTGLVYDPAGQIVFDADEQVQHALRLVFDTFEQVGAALGVVQYFAENHLNVPTRLYGGIGAGQLIWHPLDHGRVLAILHNPSYAGTYVYGRTKTRSVLGAIPAEPTPAHRELHIAAPGASWCDPRRRGPAPGPGPVRPVRAAHDRPLHG
jgi:hypothetical protein